MKKDIEWHLKMLSKITGKQLGELEVKNIVVDELCQKIDSNFKERTSNLINENKRILSKKIKLKK